MLEADHRHDSNETRCAEGIGLEIAWPFGRERQLQDFARLALMANPHETVERFRGIESMASSRNCLFWGAAPFVLDTTRTPPRKASLITALRD